MTATLHAPDTRRTEPRRAGPGPSRIGRRRAGGLLLVAIVLWVSGLRDVRLDQMSDLGLVSVLPVRTLAAFGLLAVSFCLAVRRRPTSTRVLAVHVLVLIVMLHGLSPIIESVARSNVAWRHAGIADYVANAGRIDPTIDAYFNWPGFFAVLAGFSELAGFGNPIALARWAPLAFNLGFLGAMLLILRSATDDARVRWVAAWLFVSGNWIGQDYLSPQAFTYFLALVALGLLLSWFPAAASNAERSRASRIDGRRRIIFMVIVVLLLAACVPSHQLTPIALLASVSVLVLFRRTSARGLPLLMALFVGTWAVFWAQAYLAGRLGAMFDGVGDLKGAANANVGQRVGGSHGHMVAVAIRMLLTASMWGLAGLGIWRLMRHRRPVLTNALLMATPVPLLGLQSYGGEMLLRTYLFSLPFAAVLAAAAWFPRRTSGCSWWSTATLVAVTATLLGGALVAKYGNERFDRFTEAEVAAVEGMYRVAPPGSLLLAPTGHLPWRATGYDDYDYLTFDRLPPDVAADGVSPADVVEVAKDRRASCAYLIVTRSEHAYAEMFGVLAPGELDHLEVRLRNSDRFVVVVATADATVYGLKGGSTCVH